MHPIWITIRFVVAVCLVAALTPGALDARGTAPTAPTAPTVPTVPEEPDYTRLSSWAAHPDVADEADRLPPGETDRQAEAAADVFFVHPTTWLALESGNADVGSRALNRLTDRTTIRSQASVFNGAGRVYAPRYRQASLGAATRIDFDSVTARALAFSDVLAAFDHFLDHWNDGRPIVLAGHSQGSQHALRLLEVRFAGRPLRKRLVAAYLAGVPMPNDKFRRTLRGLSRCRTPVDQRCVASWNTIAADADRSRFRNVTLRYPEGWESNLGKKLHCTNPMSFGPGGAAANGPRRAVRARGRRLRLVPGPDTARCRGGLLVIDPPPGSDFPAPRDGDYHVFDYGLFYLDVREAVTRRVDAAEGRSG